MKTKNVKVKINSKNFVYIIVAILLIFVFWNVFSRIGKKSIPNTNQTAKEIVEPIDLGVSDPGFERIGPFSVLNADAFLDKYDKIDGTASLKINFFSESKASVKVSNYFNKIEKDGFYRIGFWAKSNENKEINLSLAEKSDVQDIGKVNLEKGEDAKFYEINFQAKNDSEDLFIFSLDGVETSVWLDDFSTEKLNVNSEGEMMNVKPTVFGNTSWKNIDTSLTSDTKKEKNTKIAPKNAKDKTAIASTGEDESQGKSSGVFLSEANRKIGQIFKPSHNFISAVRIKVKKFGNGGTGTYELQIREFNSDLGIVSDEAIARRWIDKLEHPKEVGNEIKKQETEMRQAFADNEKAIKEGRAEDDPTGKNEFPSDFTLDQIAQEKAKKRAQQLEIKISEMKESYNEIMEIDVPISAKLEPGKEYWVGIDNANVKVDSNNYIVLYHSAPDSNNLPSYISDALGSWQASKPFWMVAYYPELAKIDGKQINSGATISNVGGNDWVYRYKFNNSDYNSSSGFSGKIIYDSFDLKSLQPGNSDGTLSLKDDDYIIYQFNTLYPADKIILRDIVYGQSLGLDYSIDGQDWKEIFSDEPATDNVKIDPIVINPDQKSDVFYLRVRPSGSDSLLYTLSVEAFLNSN